MMQPARIVYIEERGWDQKNRFREACNREVLKKSSAVDPKTPDMKPEQFKNQEKGHYQEVCNRLKEDPVVVSPFENFLEPLQFPRKSQTRPTVINRPQLDGESMERPFNSYKVLQQIGEGTYGKVFKAMDLISNQLVAMKYVRMEKETEGFPITALREIKILRELQHPNIIRMTEIVHKDDEANKEVGTYLVFEYMNHDLTGLIANEQVKLDEFTIYRIFKQLLEGLNYCHKRNILHRDLKCSNILVNNRGEAKLADFGLGRHWIIERPYTNPVISMWYRSIELLLGEEKYGPSIDMWSLGCIFGELFQRRPIFPFSSQIDMIKGIFYMCGTPTKNSWPEVKYLPGFVTLQVKPTRRTLLEIFNLIIPTLALELLDKMLCLSPLKRITAEDALKSDWIQMMDQKKLTPLQLPFECDCHEMGVKLRKKKRLSQQIEISF